MPPISSPTRCRPYQNHFLFSLCELGNQLPVGISEPLPPIAAMDTGADDHGSFSQLPQVEHSGSPGTGSPDRTAP